MQGNLECMNNFDTNETDLTSFREVLERLELSYQLEKIGKSQESGKVKER